MNEFRVFSTSPELDDAIVDSARWADEEWVHAQFAWLRQNDPVRHMSPDGYEPFWSITKFDDIRTIESDNELFINDPRPILGPAMLQQMISAATGRKHLVRSLITMDPPQHLKYRTITQQWFMRGNLRHVQDRVNALAVQSVDSLRDHGGRCDFLKDIAIWFPIRVIMSILGVPEEDEPLMMKLTQEMFGSADPDVRRSFGAESLMEVIQDFEDYFVELTRRRRENPSDDVASVIANAKIEGESLPEHETNGYYTIIATAGHDTTSSTIAGGLLALIKNPEEMHKLRQDPDQYMPSAINEMIRWVVPVRQFMRTATADCEVRDRQIKEGESCVLWYPSANRDEDVWNDPFAFRVDRPESKHLSFGYGAHVCLGQHLARMELDAFFREFLRRVSFVELDDDPRYMQSTFVGGLKSLPIHYRID